MSFIPTRTRPQSAENAPALITPLVSERLDQVPEAVQEIEKWEWIDAVEWRCDYLPEHEFIDSARMNAAADEIKATGKGLLATVRTTSEGGRFDAETRDYAEAVRSLVYLADAVDVEISHPQAPELIEELRKEWICVIASKHYWHATPTPGRMIADLLRMAELGADVAKIAATPHTPGDVLNLLQAVSFVSEELRIPIIGISMGELGQVSRVYGHVFGSAATFVAVGEESAPGQLHISEMEKFYFTP